MARNNALDAQEVGDRIARLRRELGLTQRQLGDTGVTYSLLSRVEVGARLPSLSALVILAERMREHARETIVELEKRSSLARDEERYLMRLREIALDTTALYLATGSAYGRCPFCGRDEHGGRSDGKARKRRRT